MDHTLSRLLTASALALFAGVSSFVACTRTTDRVVEPPGGADASTTTPEVTDAGAKPIGPIAPLEPIEAEPKEDFRLVRAPEFGLAREVSLIKVNLSSDRNGSGLGGAGGNAGFGGSDLRPVVANGGNPYY